LAANLVSSGLLDEIVAPVVAAAGFRLVRLRVLGGKTRTVQVMAERADGTMNVDDCAALSRALAETLDTADPIPGEYVLEVSSPGIDRPLVSPDDFARFAGHEAKVELVEPRDGRKRFKGAIANVTNDAVVLATAHHGPSEDANADRVVLPFADIAEAKLVLTDRLVRESLKARNGT